MKMYVIIFRSYLEKIIFKCQQLIMIFL